jgi:HlyD family secretion protein
LDPSSYQDLIDPAKHKIFIFRPGMNASADIKTSRKQNVVSVPIASVAPRVKGSDKNVDDQKKEKKKATDADDNATVNVENDDLEEVVFVINAEGKVEKRTVTTGVQDINNIEIVSGLKEGEQVITGPFNAVNKTLRSGTKVTVVPKDKLFEK